jgi:hypothetical protein
VGGRPVGSARGEINHWRTRCGEQFGPRDKRT